MYRPSDFCDICDSKLCNCHMTSEEKYIVEFMKQFKVCPVCGGTEKAKHQRLCPLIPYMSL